MFDIWGRRLEADLWGSKRESAGDAVGGAIELLLCVADWIIRGRADYMPDPVAVFGDSWEYQTTATELAASWLTQVCDEVGLEINDATEDEYLEAASRLAEKSYSWSQNG